MLALFEVLALFCEFWGAAVTGVVVGRGGGGRNEASEPGIPGVSREDGGRTVAECVRLNVWS